MKWQIWHHNVYPPPYRGSPGGGVSFLRKVLSIQHMDTKIFLVGIWDTSGPRRPPYGSYGSPAEMRASRKKSLSVSGHFYWTFWVFQNSKYVYEAFTVYDGTSTISVTFYHVSSRLHLSEWFLINFSKTFFFTFSIWNMSFLPLHSWHEDCFPFPKSNYRSKLNFLLWC